MAEVSKLTGYAVLDFPDGIVAASKLTGYAALDFPDGIAAVSRLNGYAVLYDVFRVGQLIELKTPGTYQVPNVPDTIEYQWQRSWDQVTWENIIGATATEYSIIPADLWYFIALAEIATNQGGTTVTRSQSLRVVES
jgi:hypothetical protein